jgi:glycosyltransferase involved in cell wall biosynthesis
VTSAAPRITVALPVRDGAATLPRALGSLLAQTCGDWELLIVDDRSRDASRRLAREFARVDPRVRVLAAAGRAGRAARLSQAIAAARGEFFARMDADDVAYPERLERQLDFLLARPEVDLVGTSLMVFGDGGAARGIRVAPPTHAVIAARPHHGLKLFHPSWCGRTAWFAKHGYWHGSRWCEDQELVFRASATSCYANLPEPLLGYREVGPRLRPILGGRADFAAAVARRRLRERRVGEAAAAVAGQAAKAMVDIVAVSCRLQSSLQGHRARPTTPDVIAEWDRVWRLSLDRWRALDLGEA